MSRFPTFSYVSLSFKLCLYLKVHHQRTRRELVPFSIHFRRDNHVISRRADERTIQIISPVANLISTFFQHWWRKKVFFFGSNVVIITILCACKVEKGWGVCWLRKKVIDKLWWKEKERWFPRIYTSISAV